MPRSDRDKQPRPSEAHEHAYRPADGSDWTDPDPKTVGEALDTLKAAPPGAGDVVGPAGATDLAIAIYDGVTGKLVKNSTILIDTDDLKFAAANPFLYADATAKVIELLSSGSADWLKVDSGGGQVTLSANRASGSSHLRLVGVGAIGYVVLLDAVDTTKVAKLDMATIGHTTTRTFTFPNANGTFVLLDATQTLTLKTLTTPIIGDLTNATHDHEDAAGGGATLKPTTIGVGRNVIASGNGNKDIDWTDGNVQTFVISGGNVDFDFDVAPPLPATGATWVHLLVTQDSTPGRLVTFNDCSRWARNETPIQTTVAGRVDLYSWLYDGTVYRGVHHPNFPS